MLMRTMCQFSYFVWFETDYHPVLLRLNKKFERSKNALKCFNSYLLSYLLSLFLVIILKNITFSVFFVFAATGSNIEQIWLQFHSDTDHTQLYISVSSIITWINKNNTDNPQLLSN